MSIICQGLGKNQTKASDPQLLSPTLTTSPGFSSADAVLSTNGLPRTPLDHRAEENRDMLPRKDVRSFVAASALFRTTTAASAPSGGTVAVPPRLSGSLSLPPENLESSSKLFALYSQYRPRSEAGCFSAPLLASVGCLPSESSAFLFYLSTSDVVGDGTTAPLAAKQIFVK